MSSFSDLKPRAQSRGVPSVATLLTWFMPGAGHFYLGRAGFGILAFVIVQGLYLLGLSLSDGMGFQFLQEELRGTFSPGLAPEAGNLGALIYHVQTYGFGGIDPQPFPAHVVLGSTLTAISGILNVCLMCHAHYEARVSKDAVSGKLTPALPVFLSWLVPGLGHFFLGRRLRGILIFMALVGCLVLGTVLADSSNLSRERHYYYWGGQLMAGLPAMLLQVARGAKQVVTRIPYAEAGLVFGSVAGLLNILMMIDVYREFLMQNGGEPTEPDPMEDAASKVIGAARILS